MLRLHGTFLMAAGLGLGLIGCGGGSTSPLDMAGTGADMAGTDMASAGVDLDQPCSIQAMALCNRLNTCSKLAIQEFFGDVDTCTARLKPVCVAHAKAPGSGASAAWLASCAASYAGISCAAFVPGAVYAAVASTLECRPTAGSLDDGKPCGDHSQCKSAFCDFSGPCGTCGNTAPLGATCSGKLPCDSDGVCVDGKCIKWSSLGDSCDFAGPFCYYGLYCKSGQCAPQLQVGEGCDPKSLSFECDGAQGLYCSAVTRKCEFTQLANAGEACSDDFSVACSAGGACLGMHGSKKCVAEAKDGEKCDTMNGPRCLGAAVCMAGICQIRDPAKCM